MGLSLEILAQTRDSDLLQMLWDYICTRFSETDAYSDDTSLKEAVQNLPRGLRVVYALSLLDGEIRNGGFRQYVSNSNGLFLHDALEALRLVGANKRADLVAANMELFDSEGKIYESATGDQSGERRWRWATKAEIEVVFDTLDAAYYGLDDSESVSDLLTIYIRTHPNDCLGTAMDMRDG